MKLAYKAGRFFRLERVSGFLSAEGLAAIGKVIPPTEEAVEEYARQYKGRIRYEKVVKKKTLFQQFVGTWMAFYNNFTGHDPRFNAVEGKNLKQIITYLKKISGSEAGALELWRQLLQNWQQLDEFHQRNTDLKYINGNINRIIENVKRGSTKKGKAKYSEDFKQKIAERLRPR